MNTSPKHFPYTLPWNNAPIDISGVFADEKPAGKHGFLTVDGDQMTFEDGAPGRFWGTNFNSANCFPEHDMAEILAMRLAKFGCNIVRFHQMDSPWSNPNIFQYHKGMRLENTRALDPTSMDRLDYLVHCLKEQGIYVYMDNLTYRKFRSGDGVENAHELALSAKPYSVFSEKLIELQQEFNEQLWTHVNPYTKLAYKDDPVVVMTEITNECDLFSQRGTLADKLEPYHGELCGKYRAWAAEHGVDIPQDIDFTSDEVRMLEFLVSVQSSYYARMREHLRGLGVKVPVAGTNWTKNAALLAADATMDFVDGHAYWWNFGRGDQRLFDNKHMADSVYTMYNPLGARKVPGKPLFVSEWDMPWPGEFRAEATLLSAAVGRLQGWTGYSIHTYRYHNEPTDKIGRDVVLGSSFYRGIFDTFNDPAKFGLFYHAALMTRRADIAEAREQRVLKVDALDTDLHGIEGMNLLPETHRVAISLPDSDDPGADPAAKAIVDQKAGEVRSDTGELYRNLKGCWGSIDAPRTKAIYGKVGAAGRIELDSLALTVETDFATIAVSSLTDDPIATSDSLLITAVGRADNTDVQYNEDHTIQLDGGRGPILVEAIIADLELTTPHEGMEVHSIDTFGFVITTLKTTCEDGVLKFRIGDALPSMYYVVQKV